MKLGGWERQGVGGEGWAEGSTSAITGHPVLGVNQKKGKTIVQKPVCQTFSKLCDPSGRRFATAPAQIL